MKFVSGRPPRIFGLLPPRSPGIFPSVLYSSPRSRPSCGHVVLERSSDARFGCAPAAPVGGARVLVCARRAVQGAVAAEQDEHRAAAAPQQGARQGRETRQGKAADDPRGGVQGPRREFPSLPVRTASKVLIVLECSPGPLQRPMPRTRSTSRPRPPARSSSTPSAAASSSRTRAPRRRSTRPSSSLPPVPPPKPRATPAQITSAGRNSLTISSRAT